MKKCLIIGNCQMDIISKILIHYGFDKIYDMKVIIIHKISEDEMKSVLNYDLLTTNLLIHQAISDNYRNNCVFSTQKLLDSKPESCRSILIPNCYFNGYFPDIFYLKDDHNRHIIKYDIAYHSRTILNYFLANKNIKDTIKTYIEVDESIDVEALAQQSIYNLIYREQNPYGTERSLDVIISDFIQDNYKKKRLFYTMNHPTNIVLEEICRRIIKLLNLSLNTNNITIEKALDDKIFPISQTVQAVLEFKEPIRMKTKDKWYTPEETINMYVNLYENHFKLTTLKRNIIPKYK